MDLEPRRRVPGFPRGCSAVGGGRTRVSDPAERWRRDRSGASHPGFAGEADHRLSPRPPLEGPERTKARRAFHRQGRSLRKSTPVRTPKFLSRKSGHPTGQIRHECHGHHECFGPAWTSGFRSCVRRSHAFLPSCSWHSWHTESRFEMNTLRSSAWLMR